MNENLKELVSTTMLEGVDYLDRTAKYLPTELIEETNSLKLSFQKLLQNLKEMGMPSNNLTTSDEHIYEPVFSVTNQISNKIENRKPIKIPATQSDLDYLTVQQNNHFIPSPDNPSIKLEVLVNNEDKGMYYCLIDNGNLLLSRKLDRQNSEYVISLDLYSFRGEKDFKIKFTHNDLVIVLLFTSKIDCDVWLEYLFKTKQSIYSYASVPISITSAKKSSPRTHSPDLQLVSDSNYPKFMRCWSAENLLDLDIGQPYSNDSKSDETFIEHSDPSIKKAANIYANRTANKYSTDRSLGGSHNNLSNLKQAIKLTKSMPHKIKSNKIEYHNVWPLNTPPRKVVKIPVDTKEDIYENNEARRKQKSKLKKSK